jgi:hypothetical protein
VRRRAQIKQGAEDEGISEAELDRPPTLEEQTQFAHNIYMIKSEVESKHRPLGRSTRRNGSLRTRAVLPDEKAP